MARQRRRRGRETGRWRATRGLLPRRDHAGLWPARRCSARCRRRWRRRYETDVRPCAGDRSPGPPLRRGRPDRPPPAPAPRRAPGRFRPSRWRSLRWMPVPAQSRETPRAPAVSYGTCASISSRDPPGTRSNSPIAPLPPPVIARAALRPDACVAEINCRHAASDRLMIPRRSEAEKCRVKGERQPGLSRILCLDTPAWRRSHWAG